MNPRSVTRLAVLPLAAAVLALAACSGDAGPTPTTASASPTATTTSTPAPSASASAAPSATTAPPAADAATCLVGTWTADEAALQDYYDQIGELAGGAMTFDTSGQAALTLNADGSYSWAPEAAITATASGIDIEVAMSGSLGGSYTATDESITTSSDTVDDLTITATAGGVEIDPGTVADQIRTAPLSNATYSCTADALALTTPVTDTDVTITLTR